MSGGRSYTIPVSNGLLTPTHYLKMGEAIWLFLWCIDKTTREDGCVGLVLGGKPVKADDVVEVFGVNERTARRWMRILVKAGYVEARLTSYGHVLRVLKSKKWPSRSDKNVRPEVGHKRPSGRTQTALRSDKKCKSIVDSTRQYREREKAESPSPPLHEELIRTWKAIGQESPTGPPAFRRFIAQRIAASTPPEKGVGEWWAAALASWDSGDEFRKLPRELVEAIRAASDKDDEGHRLLTPEPPQHDFALRPGQQCPGCTRCRPPQLVAA